MLYIIVSETKNRETKKKMIRVLCLLIFAFLTIVPSANGSSVGLTLEAPDIIETTCTKCAQRSMTSLPYCLSSLQVIPSVSHELNLAGLGVVAMELVHENATTTTETIQAMLDVGASSDKWGLGSCLEMYQAATQAVEDAVNAFLMDNFSAANKYMVAVQKVAENCDFVFEDDSGKASPLVEENRNLKELSSIVLCIIKLVSRN